MNAKIINQCATLVALASLFLLQPVQAQDAVSESQISAAEADKALDRLSFGQWVKDFEKQFVPVGRPDPAMGRIFLTSKAVVHVPSNHPGYAKELVLAYEKAMLELQVAFILQNDDTITTQRISQFMSDDSESARKFDDSKAVNPVPLKSSGTEMDMDTLLADIDARVDQYLVQQGESREKVSRMSVPEKKQLFRNNLIRETVKIAVQNMRGLVPVQTRLLTLSTANGERTQIGVIAVQSEKTRQFAEDIRLQRTSMVKGSGKRH